MRYYILPGFIETDYGPEYLRAYDEPRDKVAMVVNWYDYLFTPMVEELRKRMPDVKVKAWGPQGLRCICSMEFDDSEGNHAYIALDVGDLDKGEMRRVDYSNKTGYFERGTIGWLNDMNYGSADLPPTIEEFVQEIRDKLEEDDDDARTTPSP